MARIANPYFVRTAVIFLRDTCFDCDTEKTIIRAFATKREALDFVQDIQDKYDRDNNDYTMIQSLKVQQNWVTLWEY